jgi:Mg-chelatase subunit ChlD
MAAKKSKKDPNTPKKPRGRPKKAKKVTYVALVVDRSGSMGTVQQAAYTGINEQIKSLRDNASKGGDTFVTYVQFDNVIDLLFDKKPAKDLVDIRQDQYQPRGSTAMYDAVWTAIKRLKDGVTETADTGFLVVVISDGYENASREVTGTQLAAEIKLLEASGKWTFSYMLSNQDLKVVQQTLNLSIGNMASYVNTSTGTVDAFLRSADSTAQYLNTRSKGITAVKDFYTEESEDSK